MCDECGNVITGVPLVGKVNSIHEFLFCSDACRLAFVKTVRSISGLNGAITFPDNPAAAQVLTLGKAA